jgi:Xaa-Pro dipeptidase
MEKENLIWASEIPKNEFEDRLKKIKTSMKRDDIDAILIYSYPRQFPASRAGFIRYVSNWDGENVYAPSLAVVQAEQEPVLMISNPNFLHIVKDVSWIQDVRSGKEPDFPEEISKILPSDTGKVGLVGLEEVPYRSYEALRRVLPKTQFIDATSILENLRMIKSPREMDAIRKTVRLADLSLEAFVDAAKEDVWEYEATAKLEYAVKSRGAQDCRVSIASGPVAGLQPPNPMARKFRKRDSIVVTPIPCYKGYWCQTVRTGTIGRPSKEQQDIFDIITEAQNTAVKSIKQGTHFSDAYKAAADIIEKSKYVKYKHVHFRFGHGIGLDYTERPVIFFDSPQDLAMEVKVGMTIVIHVNLHIPELRIGASVGDTVLVTDRGVELPSKFERGLFIA